MQTLRITSLRSEYAVLILQEPGRGGKMLEETALDYALVSVFRNLRTNGWSESS